eukprot:EG_transcript_39297
MECRGGAPPGRCQHEPQHEPGTKPAALPSPSVAPRRGGPPKKAPDSAPRPATTQKYVRYSAATKLAALRRAEEVGDAAACVEYGVMSGTPLLLYWRTHRANIEAEVAGGVLGPRPREGTAPAGDKKRQKIEGSANGSRTTARSHAEETETSEGSAVHAVGI